jgi:Tfp pilus assembly protein PilX
MNRPTPRLLLRAEDGMTMIMVMVVMLVATVVSSATLLAAQSDLPFSAASSERKQAYAAAEAGVEYYLYQLTQDNDYWTKCASVPAPAPVNLRWASGSTDPRKWRTLTGTKAAYTIEVLPKKGQTQCVPGSAETTMLDQATGTFRVRSTGRVGKTERTIVTSFRRTSFLDFLYFTDFETLDPDAYTGTSGTTSPGWATANCRNWRPFRNASCQNIQFVSDDANNGPFHTNDSILACGNYTMGRTKADRIEISQPAGVIHPGTSGSCDAGGPNIKGTKFSPADTLTMPTTNAKLREEAAKDGRIFTGTTTIQLKGNVMDVWDQNGVYTANMALPNNGVIYVDNGACTTTVSPLKQMYNEPKGCANVTVFGTYSKNLTIGSAKDIILGPRLNPSTLSPTASNGDLKRSGDVVMGLIANNFVRIQHAVNRTGSNVNTEDCDSNRKAPDGKWMHDITIEAAILSLQHSFIADNYRCGERLGTVTVNGAIAQRFRGPVGLVGSKGFIKDYNYDDRLRYRSPPFFLDPISAAWGVVRQNEQVPAAMKPNV